MIPNSSRIGPKLENTNLIVLHSSPSLEFFNFFITDDFVSKMADQLLYAVQRGTPRSFNFKPDGS